MMRERTTKRPTVPGAEDILGGYFPVLDHGFVALVDYMGSDQAIEDAARISYGQGTRKVSATRTLLRYLRRHLHTTPSEMVELKFHCAMPIFVARQWIRHRTASVNEYSARYSILPMHFYTPGQGQLSPQSKTNRQGRESEGASGETYMQAINRWQTGRESAAEDYRWLTEQDVAREIARIDLPLSTYTQWYWKIDLHNLLHFLTLRVDPHAQWEIRQYAEVIAGMVRRVAPLSYEAWIDYQLDGERFSRPELEAVRLLIDVFAVRLLFPIAAVGFAGVASSNDWGMLNRLDLPLWLACVLALVLLDLAIYTQHVVTHKVPLLWRLHRVHHSDPDFDISTAIRFHPIEILLSMLFKALLIFALGPPVVAVIIFEILLNGCAVFNHANARLPESLDRALRRILVTPDMHRVHHSTRRPESDANYGFSLAIWDRIFGTYQAQPQAGHTDMTIGMPLAQGYFTSARLSDMLRLPFWHKVTARAESNSP